MRSARHGGSGSLRTSGTTETVRGAAPPPDRDRAPDTRPAATRRARVDSTPPVGPVTQPATCHSPPRVTDVHDALGAIDGVRFTTAEASYLTWIDVADAMPDVGMSAAEFFTEARRDHRRDHY